MKSVSPFSSFEPEYAKRRPSVTVDGNIHNLDDMKREFDDINSPTLHMSVPSYYKIMNILEPKSHKNFIYMLKKEEIKKLTMQQKKKDSTIPFPPPMMRPKTT